jgi:hypothetical protein
MQELTARDFRNVGRLLFVDAFSGLAGGFVALGAGKSVSPAERAALEEIAPARGLPAQVCAVTAVSAATARLA